MPNPIKQLSGSECPDSTITTMVIIDLDQNTGALAYFNESRRFRQIGTQRLFNDNGPEGWKKV